MFGHVIQYMYKLKELKLASKRFSSYTPEYKREHHTPAPATIRYYQSLLVKAFYCPLTMLRSLCHKGKNEKLRIMRSDGEVNMLDVLYAMLDDTDLTSQVWGMPYKNEQGIQCFYTQGIEWLADKLGISASTVKRHLARAEKEGYIEKKLRRGYDKDGKLLTHYALRKFTHKFFFELDQGKQINCFQKYHEKKNAAKNSAKLSNMMKVFAQQSNINQLVSKMRIPFKKPDTPKEGLGLLQNGSITQKKLLVDRAFGIAASTGRSVGDVLRELNAQTI